MSDREIERVFRIMTACALIPLVAASAYLLHEVLAMTSDPSYPLAKFAEVPEIIELLLRCVAVFLTAYFMLVVFIHRKNIFRKK